MADRRTEFLLIGGGMASANCAGRLRELGAEGGIMLVGREPDPPYERPPLSKDYLRRESERADAYVHDPSWYEENGVELRLRTNVTSLDTEARTAKLQGGEEVAFEKGLIATGAMVNILRIEGAALEGIHYLRAFGNSDAIREEAAGAERVVLVGGSYIATEVAASLTALGKSCALVMLEDVILERQFGAEAGRWFQRRLEEHGVEIHGGQTVAAFEGDERFEGLVTESGDRVEGDLVVVGAGVRPDTMLAGRAGLAVEDGILCDSTLQTSAEGIYAAGDCCNYESVLHGRRLRVEHWDVALQQGRVAAENLLGAGRNYDVVPYFFSDLADWASLEYVGPAQSWDDEVWRGDPARGDFLVWYLQGGKVAAALSVGRSADLAEARRLIAGGADVSADREALADPDADLGALG